MLIQPASVATRVDLFLWPVPYFKKAKKAMFAFFIFALGFVVLIVALVAVAMFLSVAFSDETVGAVTNSETPSSRVAFDVIRARHDSQRNLVGSRVFRLTGDPTAAL